MFRVELLCIISSQLLYMQRMVFTDLIILKLCKITFIYRVSPKFHMQNNIFTPLVTMCI